MIQVILLGLTGFLSVVCLYYRYNYNYWKRKGVCQATPVLFFGNLLDLILGEKNAGWIYDEIYREFPNNDAVGFYEFQTPKLMVKNPDLIQKVLISEFSSFHDNEFFTTKELDPYLEFDPFVIRGEDWKKARNALISGLTQSKLKEMYQLMNQTIEHLDTYIDDNLGKEIEAKDLANLFMMTNVSNAVYGIVSNCFTDTNAAFRKMSDLFLREYWQRWWDVLVVFFMPNVKRILRYSFVPRKVSNYVEDMVRQVAEAKLKSSVKRNDFFQYYLSRNRPDEENIHEVINHGMTFFIAGMETSSIPAGSTLFELALNPAIQETLYQEICSAYNGSSELDYDTLTNLPYLDKVVKETMRKYPIVYSLGRICTKTTTLEIDGRKVQIEAGTPVMAPLYSIHYDPCYYQDPQIYNPERFNDDIKMTQTPCTYFPFGAGPRICPGMKFGTVQIKLFLSNIINKYKVLVCNRTPPKVTLSKTAFVVSPSDQWIKFEKRK